MRKHLLLFLTTASALVAACALLWNRPSAPMSQLPDHEKWGWGAVEGVFAGSPVYAA